MVKKTFTVKRLLMVLISVWSYSWIVVCTQIVLHSGQFSLGQILSSMLPLSYKQYWFATCYVIMYLLSPFLNKLIHSLQRNEYFIFVIMLVIMGSVWTDLLPLSDPIYLNGGYSVGWFLVLYCISGYIRLYWRDMYNAKTCKFATLYSIITLMMLLIESILTILSGKIGIIEKWSLTTHLSKYNSVLTLTQSLALFLCFMNLGKQRISAKASKVISKVSSLTFGVYLIHDNPLLRQTIYFHILKTDKLSSDLLTVGVLLLYAFIIFVACAGIEKIRKMMFLPLENVEWVNKLCLKVQDRINKYFDKYLIS